MGMKSILYFEIVTTIALFIGLLAINISQAGVGVKIEARDSDSDKATSILKDAHVDLKKHDTKTVSSYSVDTILRGDALLNAKIEMRFKMKMDSISQTKEEEESKTLFTRIILLKCSQKILLNQFLKTIFYKWLFFLSFLPLV
jgi:hypothetical protein